MSEDQEKGLQTNQNQKPSPQQNAEVPVDYTTLLRQVIEKARPIFEREAREYNASGLRYNVDSPEVIREPKPPKDAVLDPNAIPMGVFSQDAYASDVTKLGYLEVTGMDTPDTTRIAFRSETGGKDFDIIVDTQGVQVVGVSPQEAWQAMDVLTRKVDRFSMFDYDGSKFSLGTTRRVETPFPLLSPGDTLGQISSPSTINNQNIQS